MNFFNQGIPLGRWFGIKVVIHWTFVLYAAYSIFTSPSPAMRALLMGLLFATVLLHEFGHALSCIMVGGEARHIVLWPLGGIAFVQPPMKAWAWLVTTVCGPLVNAVLWPVFYLATYYLIVGHYGLEVWQLVQDEAAKGFFVVDPSFTVPENICLAMWQVNRLLLLFNLIPGYPMDGGRLLQEILWFSMGYGRSLQIAGMVGTVVGAGFVVLGLGLRTLIIPVINYQLGTEGKQNSMLVIIGILVAMQSFGIYKQSQEIKGWRKN
jgi:Zn-dependent protease